MKKQKIIQSFFIRGALATFITTILATTGIYFYQHKVFTDSLEQSIKTNIDSKLYNYEDLVDINMTMLKKDSMEIMEKAHFLLLEVYDKEKEEILTLESLKQEDREDMVRLEDHDQILTQEFPKNREMVSHFFEIDEHYYIRIFYSVYKNGRHIGYIEGISKLSDDTVHQFFRGRVVAITTVVITVIVLVISIFPLIYFAYKQLNTNRLVLLSSNIMTLNTLGNAIALRDSDTNEHNYRVTIYAIKLAQKLKMPDEEIRKLIKGAFLHDVGKIGIEDRILLKNGKLTDEEFEIMKEHVIKGAELIKGNSWLKDSKDIILYHHEKYDGSGYPHGLKDGEIPICAKIFSIVDVFDALTSKRPYKESFSFEKSIGIIKEGSGSHFDPKLVEEFLAIAKELYDGVRLKNQADLKKELDALVKIYFL